jgi:hypothetical protein
MSNYLPHFYNATDALAWFAWRSRFAAYKAELAARRAR